MKARLQQSTPMKINPLDGWSNPIPNNACMFRSLHEGAVWKWCPWTSNRRHESDIESDPTGILILPPGEPLYAAAKSQNFVPSKCGLTECKGGFMCPKCLHMNNQPQGFEVTLALELDAYLIKVHTAGAGETRFFTAASDPRGYPVYRISESDPKPKIKALRGPREVVHPHLEKVGWQRRYICPEEGPGSWVACNEEDVHRLNSDYEVRPVYAFVQSK